jgi:hypothetical protein
VGGVGQQRHGVGRQPERSLGRDEAGIEDDPDGKGAVVGGRAVMVSVASMRMAAMRMPGMIVMPMIVIMVVIIVRVIVMVCHRAARTVACARVSHWRHGPQA